MIKLKQLLNEEDIGNMEKKIIDILSIAEKEILSNIKRSDELKNGKIKWETKGNKFPGHIDFKEFSGMDENVYIIKLKIIEPEYNEEAVIYAKGYIDERKNEIIYKANVFHSSGKGEVFRKPRNMFRYLEDEIRDFKFPDRIA